MRKAQLVVRTRSARATRGFLVFGPLRWPCALGRGGIRALKREGDGATPRGRFGLDSAYYRADKLRRSPFALPLRAISRDLGWCDATSDRNYNRSVRHPYPASAECMWREDGLYDLVVVLGYNIRPRIKGRGSAIFMHVARQGLPPTEGCIALRRDHLVRVLGMVRPRTRIVVP